MLAFAARKMRSSAVSFVRLTLKTAGLIGYTMLCLILTLIGAELYYRFNEEAYLRAVLVAFDPPVYESSDTMPYTLAKNVDFYQFRRGEYFAHAHTNAQGLREDREIQIDKPANTFRLLTIGDSYVYGYGVERGETFQAVAETALRSRHAGKSIEIIDMGFAAAGDLYSRYIYVRDVALKYKPDAIVVDLNYSADLGRLLENRPYLENGPDGLPKSVQYKPIVINPNSHLREGRYDFETEASGQLFLSYPPPALGRTPFQPSIRESFRLIEDSFAQSPYDPYAICRAFRLCLIYEEYKRLQALRDPKTGMEQFDLQLLPAKPAGLSEDIIDLPDTPKDALRPGTTRFQGWAIATKLFLGMKGLADKEGIRFGVLMIPTPEVVDYDPSLGEDQIPAKKLRSDDLAIAARLDKPSKIYGRFFEENSIPFLHPLKAMHEERIRSHHDLYFHFDDHWNRYGQQVLGNLVADWVERTGWLKN